MTKKLLTPELTNTIYLCNAKQINDTDLFEVIGEKEDLTKETISNVSD